MAKKKKKIVCEFCGGTGQLSFFKGESRFLLSTEECSECAGTGFQLDSDKDKAKKINK
jgi:DnaJ-class molecular chaperone